jgi:hypothetical protein
LIDEHDFIRSSANAIVNPARKLTFLEHPHDLDALDGGIGRLYGLKSQHGFDDALNAGMVDLHALAR